MGKIKLATAFNTTPYDKGLSDNFHHQLQLKLPAGVPRKYSIFIQ